MNERVNINGSELKKHIKKLGLSYKELGTILDIPAGTISACLSQNYMYLKNLKKICLMAQVNENDFIIEEEKRLIEKPDSIALKANEDVQKEIKEINDALSSLVKMTETIMNSIKRISDEMSTIKNTNFSAEQESKHFHQESLF